MQRKFRVWADDECLQIKKGAFGIQFNLLKWENIQYVELQQSLYQQKQSLATVHFKTAGGELSMPFLSLEKAMQLRNYALYKMETSDWL